MRTLKCDICHRNTVGRFKAVTFVTHGRCRMPVALRVQWVWAIFSIFIGAVFEFCETQTACFFEFHVCLVYISPFLILPQYFPGLSLSKFSNIVLVVFLSLSMLIHCFCVHCFHQSSFFLPFVSQCFPGFGRFVI